MDTDLQNTVDLFGPVFPLAAKIMQAIAGSGCDEEDLEAAMGIVRTLLNVRKSHRQARG